MDSPVLESGDELSLRCSCVVSQSSNTTFYFYKDRIGDTDQDIRERYEDSDYDIYRLEFTKLVSTTPGSEPVFSLCLFVRLSVCLFVCTVEY